MDSLIYTQLPPPNPTGKTIAYSRILELWPGEGADPFYGTLVTVDIEKTPFAFEALSYVWGREQSDFGLLCGDQQGCIRGQVPITKNLEHALRSLRLPEERRWLWVDAVCINQEDLDERARQVGYMRSVYQHASQVVIWLGLKDGMVRRAFTFAGELALLIAGSAANASNTEFHGQAQDTEALLESAVLNTMDSRSDDTRALDALFSKEYFERVWCIQEVAAANLCIAKSEDLEINFTILLILVPAVLRQRGLNITPSGLGLWQLVAQQKLGGYKSNVLSPAASLGPMLLLMMIIRNFKATNPRDRIFALLGCTDEGLQPVLSTSVFGGNRNSRTLTLAQRGLIWFADRVNSVAPGVDIARNPALKPDYHKSVQDVYRDFTRYCIRTSPRLLDVLSHVQHHSDLRPDDPFPTWVPKFHETQLASFFVSQVGMAGIPPKGHYPYFAVVHDNPLRPDGLWRPGLMEPDVLQADGFRVDVVQYVSKPIIQDSSGHISPEEIWNQLFVMPLFPRPAVKYLHGNEALDVTFFLTLLAGGVGNAVQHMLTASSYTDRSEALDFITRQAKSDIHGWLENRPDVDSSSYPDLIQNLEGIVRNESRLRFETASVAYSFNRKMYQTHSGILGLGPKIMQAGDVVAVLFGGRFPFILRPIGSEWLFIGETYIRNEHIMEGHAVTEVRTTRPGQAETFRMR